MWTEEAKILIISLEISQYFHFSQTVIWTNIRGWEFKYFFFEVSCSFFPRHLLVRTTAKQVKFCWIHWSISFLDPTCELGSFLLSVFPSFRQFSCIDLLVFSETLHVVRVPHGAVRDAAGFFWKKWSNLMFCVIWYHLYNLKNVKNIHGGVLLLIKLQVTSQMIKNGQKLPLNMVFPLFRKMKSLLLSGSQVMAKNAPSQSDCRIL